MPFIDRDQTQLYYEVHGDGPAILLTHGFAAESRMWKGQIADLCKKNTLILWDMRGHGRTKAPAEDEAFSEAETVKDMAAILDATGFETAVIGGLSLGGYMSLAFNLSYPERVDALLIIDTGPGYKSETSRAEWNVQANKMTDALAVKGLDGIPGLSAEMRLSEHFDPGGLVRAGRHMLTQHTDDVIQSLPSISAPTLIVVGADDKPYLIGSEYMAQKISGSRKEIIPDAGHAVNIDQPDRFNSTLIDFLSENGLSG